MTQPESLLRGRYTLIGVLGAGGFGQTFLAVDTQQPEQPRCVIKQFKPVKTDAAFLEIARRLFETEVAMLRKLGQHPQIPAFIDFFEENGEFYLVQEYIDGHPLSEEFSATRRLSEAEAIELLQDVLGILDFVHSQQVIHRDIKPGNLLRRASDGKVVLIDFGAVKEIRTQLISDTEQKFTVGIGTQGYTPSEQLAGQPRYCSDLYALGVTIIHAVTGIQPTQLPTDPETAELLWQSQAPITLGFQLILEKMVRYHFSQRYQSVREVQQALERLAAAPLDTTMMPSELVMPDSLLRSPAADSIAVDTPPQRRTLWRHLKPRMRVMAIAALTATGVIGALNHLGWLQAPELAVYDQLVQLRPDRGHDPRLLVVGITESDLQTLQRGTPSDRDVAQVIRTLRQYQPRAIGLDLHRELPQEPGHAELRQALQFPEVVTIMTLGNERSTFTIPPPAGVPAERLGFNDLLIDPDGVVRRNLILASIGEEVFYSFSLRLALKYLAAEGITPQESASHPGLMQLGSQTLVPLAPHSGGYQRLDAAGYQLLLDYRSPVQPARQVSFMEVLRGQIDPNWVRDKVVLIGTVAPSSKDLFYTPFSAGRQSEHLMSGVVVHAQMVSQVLGLSLNESPAFRFLPTWGEWLWIGIWAVAGAGLAGWLRHPGLLGSGVLLAGGILAGTTWLGFYVYIWLPSIGPILALGLAGAVVVSWRAYAPKLHR
ncbi:MAG: CHASE2 domain-containing protein [Synechococcales cyanobacterium M58_A2018_015]|nr:CHASE2 domain-containing protein [Synechococcales cyanobacterium M58_A2018_015]